MHVAFFFLVSDDPFSYLIPLNTRVYLFMGCTALYFVHFRCV